MSSHSPITLTDLGFDWPDGSTALADLDATFGAGRTGLVGRNGSGKSTLLRLIAGELTPSRGSVRVGGEVACLPQRLTLDTDRTLSDLLGVREKLAALQRIGDGSTEVADYEILGDDWDLEARAAQTLASIGLAGVNLERRIGTLSGGETTLAAIAGVQLRQVPIALLDEPTNNLDGDAREILYALVRGWRGTLVVASHDPMLLEEMDGIAELYAGRLTLTGGGFTAWQNQLEAEQQAAQRAVRDAEQQLRKEKRERIEAETKLARRKKYADKDFANKRRPKIVMNTRKSQAEVSAGKLRGQHEDRIAAAVDALGESEARVRDADRVTVDLPDAGVAQGRRMAELIGTGSRFVIQGPERIALTGANGVGKTCLLETLVDPETPRRLPAYGIPLARIGYLPQRLDGLDDARSAVQNLRDVLPGASMQDVRGRLARFLLRGAVVERPVGSLSGGERFRVALAALLLAEPPAQLLILDEPTNSLDLDTVDQLVEALASYRGGLLVVSHDRHFLSRLGIDRFLDLDVGGVLTEYDPGPTFIE